MKIYDISLTIRSNLPVWPGDPAVILERVAKMEDGSPANVTHMSMGAHVGTHVDAPYHFLGGNTPTVESLSLNTLTGRVHVIEIPAEVSLITAEVLKGLEIPGRARRVIFKTRNSRYWQQGVVPFQKDFVSLSDSGANYVRERGFTLVGIDYLSIAPYADGVPTHKILLEAGVVILEGLDLSAIQPGRYMLYCLPIKLAGADGAPARAILVGV